MNLKEYFVEFEAEKAKTEEKSLNNYVRTSYAGGFRMFKSSPKASVCVNSQESFHNLKLEIEELKNKTRQTKKRENSTSRNRVEPDYHIEENNYLENIQDLKQLQNLKEQKVKRIVEIEAELRRNKVEKGRGKKDVKKCEKKRDLDGYQKRFEAKFENYRAGKTAEKKESRFEVQEDRKILETGMGSPVREGKNRQNGGKRDEGVEERHQQSSNIPKEVLVGWVFKRLDSEQTGFISLEQVTDEITQNLDFSQLFYIPASLTEAGEIHEYLMRITRILNVPAEKLSLEDFLRLSEFTGLNKEFSKSSPRQLNPKCLLPQDLIFVFESIFDSFSSDQVSRQGFIDCLIENSDIRENLSLPAVRMSESETVDLASVLQFIRIDKGNELTWHQFLEYFYLNSPNLPKRCLDVFREAFEEISDEPNAKVSTYTLLNLILNSERVAPYLQMTLSSSFRVSDILETIKDQAPSFLTLQQFLSYFVQSPITTHKTFHKTVPELFSFESRPKKSSIREQKVSEMLQEKAEIENFHLNYRPKLTSVPRAVKVPLYEQMIEAHKQRSEEIKRESVEKTLQLERPFSFYQRDKERKKAEPVSPKVYRFKANPIPRSSSVQIFRTMQGKVESDRKERLAIRAQELMRESSLPPRMQLYAEKSKNCQEVVIDELPHHKFHATDPPEFSKLHQKFQKTLEAKKKARKSTIVEPFTIDERAEAIHERRKKEKGEKPEIEKLSFKAKDPPNFRKLFEDFQTSLQAKKIVKLPIKTQPFAMEKRSEDLKAKKQQIKEEETKKNDSKKIQPMPDKKKTENLKILKEKLQKIINKTIEKNKSQGLDLESKGKQKEIYAAEQERKFKQSLNEMQIKVYQKPLLVELNEQTHSMNMSKGKALSKIKDQLLASKLLTKNYFTAEELSLIHLYEKNST